MKQIDDQIKKFGNWLVDTFHFLALFVIGGTIVWAAVHEYLQMIDHGRAGLDGIPLLYQHILVITGAIVLLVMAVATISIVRVKFPEKEPSG